MRRSNISDIKVEAIFIDYDIYLKTGEKIEVHEDKLTHEEKRKKGEKMTARFMKEAGYILID